MTSFNYQERLKNNKNNSIKDLIEKLSEEGIKRAQNSKKKNGVYFHKKFGFVRFGKSSN